MCKECTINVSNAIRELVNSKKSELKTAQGIPFTILGYSNEFVGIRTSTNNKRYIHTKCLVYCYSKMFHEKLHVTGVGSENQHNSIRSLVKDCANCDRSPAYIWGILNSFPEVMRLEKNQLKMYQY